ncbi:hypothetical protein [Streptomyces aidingensis]|uniref:Nucleotidyltransferase domain-containing protein n=1 Tax=Streptomyces aidingensis TaxID=910347 RepID=A0A1I1GY29_9ACTN|nr:hypothetical protein [Streptomyces aidingensis]SFC16584.1 hypothetical protein SAMN05421773_102177 [Streptomyces aidingensis]
MTTPPPATDLNLDAVTAKGWAERGDFTPAEYERAEQFYDAMRVHDDHLTRVRAEAAALIEEWTGHAPRDVGSFGTRLNLETSDLDLGIGYPVDQREVLRKALDGHARFLGERATRFSTTRLVFSFTLEGIEVDLSALTVEDFTVACRMLDQIAENMDHEERVCHTWIKHLLRASGRLEEYAGWKLVTYRRFCPEFNWVPIPEKTGT